jgi:hypothetical protein
LPLRSEGAAKLTALHQASETGVSAYRPPWCSGADDGRPCGLYLLIVAASDAYNGG